jgi:cytochrome c oxidase cbb3-type subunit I/II
LKECRYIYHISFLSISNRRFYRNYSYAYSKDNVPTIASVKPYSPLELEGRDLYIREGCNACHSQMIRPFRDEVVRFNGKNGQYSKAGEFVYDRPFLWGSKRTGPDLQRRW